MSLFDKLLREQERHPAHPAARARETAAGAAVSPASEPIVRPSSCLKDFLWHLSDIENKSLLDLGAVSQSTLNFFLERGFKIYTDDLLRDWREHLAEEEKCLRARQVGGAPEEEFNMADVARRFAASALKYPAGSFTAALLWDAFDYIEAAAIAPVVARLHELLRPGGAMLGLFHSKKPEVFHRYRVRDAENFELLQTQPLLPHVRVLQNRDLLNLFADFRTSKTYVGRDNLREALFLR